MSDKTATVRLCDENERPLRQDETIDASLRRPQLKRGDDVFLAVRQDAGVWIYRRVGVERKK